MFITGLTQLGSMAKSSTITPELYRLEELPSENEIMSTWRTSQVLVSISCTCYNHSRYITSALNSFILQKTAFAFEVIVHDDASTDGSPDIIARYQARYPNIIKPIYQTENQYSQGRKSSIIAFRKATGKYIALCEGDDFWIDRNKLQLQAENMERMPFCDLSFHSAVWHYEDGRKRNFVYAQRAGTNKVFDIKAMILGKGQFCPTASLMFKRQLILDLPEWYYRTSMGDHYLQVLGARRGGALYINRCMSAYRNGVPGSWTKRKQTSLRFRYDFALLRNLQSIDELDQYLGYRYTTALRAVKKSRLSTFQRELKKFDAPPVSKIKYQKAIKILKKNEFNISDQPDPDTITLTATDFYSYYSIKFRENIGRAVRKLWRVKKRAAPVAKRFISAVNRDHRKSLSASAAGKQTNFTPYTVKYVHVHSVLRDDKCHVPQTLTNRKNGGTDRLHVPIPSAQTLTLDCDVKVNAAFKMDETSITFKGCVLYKVTNQVVRPPHAIMITFGERELLSIPLRYRRRKATSEIRIHLDHLPGAVSTLSSLRVSLYPEADWIALTEESDGEAAVRK
ncbi:glycosyltransferase involved in cell wall biosynthesis [Alkalispirillum mobile]|uniref:Glycosyltransferase involved in cell wall biosynthesis n=1 Tax=Alkalispirillum mobile TaxID=85925 RepID=A0A498BYH0_9GAMM|nr:glycosyltransferase [Alkalispirillum mobile]RLK48372.1 glycosyltransferase involved in cell wall biosynthesis [Alkalispirillum mobile]